MSEFHFILPTYGEYEYETKKQQKYLVDKRLVNLNQQSSEVHSHPSIARPYLGVIIDIHGSYQEHLHSFHHVLPHPLKALILTQKPDHLWCLLIYTSVSYIRQLCYFATIDCMIKSIQQKQQITCVCGFLFLKSM